MEKFDKERECTEPDDSKDVRIAKEMEDDQPQKQQASESQMEGAQSASEIKEGPKNETSEGLTGSVSHEILQPKIEQHEETMQNVSEEISETSGLEHESVIDSNRPVGEERELEEVKQSEQELLVQQAQQVVELVHEEAVICDVRQDRMEEADDIEEPQKYAFRGKEED